VSTSDAPDAQQLGCELCAQPGGVLLFKNAEMRVVAVGGDEGAAYPGFCRVIWRAHVREMTDLDEAARTRFMRAVFCVEAALRLSLNPDKINLASLGNMTPHLHWHVIPRYANDATFPKPIWAGGVDPSSAPIPKSSTAWHDAIRTALIGL
jgi:diadenosine tetraphosphate (Ap4A) HIT family hydrolase